MNTNEDYARTVWTPEEIGQVEERFAPEDVPEVLELFAPHDWATIYREWTDEDLIEERDTLRRKTASIRASRGMGIDDMTAAIMRLRARRVEHGGAESVRPGSSECPPWETL
jgi:hypothetical protein